MILPIQINSLSATIFVDVCFLAGDERRLVGVAAA